jgi:hypothetical protein
VRLIDRTGQTDDTHVNLLIKNKKLNIVTEDTIPVKEGMVAYDARDGFAMGVLGIGDEANFMIIDGDPYVDLEVLLDTKANQF